MKTTKKQQIIVQIGVKALIFNKEDKVLLLKCVPRENSGVYWDMPGGRIQGKESLASNLKREIFEETGLKGINIGKIVGVQEFQHEHKHIIRLTYVARVTSIKKIMLSDEHSEYKWFSLSELSKQTNLDRYLRILIKDKEVVSFIRSYLDKS